MDKRTKILATLFGAALAYVVLAQVVYPTWVRPLFTLDEQIKERRAELDKLEKMQKSVDDARIEYRDYVARIGSFDAGQVETAIRDRVNALIEKYKLENAGVSPARPVEDRKTGLTTTVISVSATGSLEAAVNFMKEVAELPQLVRVGNPSLNPAGTGKKGAEQDLVSLRLPIEVLVLPQHKTVGRIEPSNLPKTETFVRHSSRDFADIWNHKPFLPPVEYPPLRVDVPKVVNVEVGQQAILQATPSGGNGEYKIEWSPKEGLTEPNQARTVADSTAPRTQTYTVTVTDTHKDHPPVTATVALTVREKTVPKPPDQPTQPVQKVETASSWPDASVMQIVMTLMRNSGSTRTNELMVYNTRTKESNYYKVTDDFDAGKLVFVHQTGGVVGKKGKYYVYPLGTMLSEAVEYQNAGEYPELKSAAERAVALETARAEARKASPPVENPPGAVLPTGLEPREDSRGGQVAQPQPGGPPGDLLENAGPVAPAQEPPVTQADINGPPAAPSGQGAASPPTPQVQPGTKEPQPPNTNPAAPGARPRPSKGRKPGGRL